MRNTALFALALIASAAAITPTVAEAFEPVAATSIVHTADLDLATQAGRHELDLRIAQAAREVCGSASDVDLEGKNAARRCRKETVAKAAAQRQHQLAAARAGTAMIVASAR